MDAKTRAEKSADNFWKWAFNRMGDMTVGIEEFKTKFASQLEEAVREAVDRPLLDQLAESVKYKKRVYSEGFAAAREKAAGILDQYTIGKEYAKAIRAMQPDGKEGV